MNVDENLAVTIGGGFFVVAIIGYALKKVLKILAIVVGMFFVGLVYLQYQQIVSVNWDKVQTKSEGQLQLLQMLQHKYLIILVMRQAQVIPLTTRAQV
jgi:uncharacterized membrane protein (Fun14 family)